MFDAIDRVAREQHGIVAFQQLVDVGLTASQIFGLRKHGQLLDLHRGVYKVAGAPETWRQRVMAAVAAGMPRAYASHRTAASLHPLERGRGGIIEILTEHHQRVQHPDVKCHETLDLPAADQWRLDGIPVTAIERTLIDVGRYWDAGYVGSLLDRAVRDRLTTYKRFEARVHALARRGRNGIGVARIVLADRGFDDGWGFEAAMSKALREAELPRPTREWQVKIGLQKYYVDFAYPEAMLGIECDSTLSHTMPYQFENDLIRQNEITGTGILLLRYTPSRLRRHQDEVIDEIRLRYSERTIRR